MLGNQTREHGAKPSEDESQRPLVRLDSFQVLQPGFDDHARPRENRYSSPNETANHTGSSITVVASAENLCRISIRLQRPA